LLLLLRLLLLLLAFVLASEYSSARVMVNAETGPCSTHEQFFSAESSTVNSAANCKSKSQPNDHFCVQWTKTGKNVTNYHKIFKLAIKIYQMVVKYRQHFQFQGHPKCTKIGIFGMQIYNLATACWRQVWKSFIWCKWSGAYVRIPTSWPHSTNEIFKYV
jgi:hypothetical protein